MSKRIFWIVLDSVGCGEAPDAEAFGDKGSDTLGSCYKSGLMDVPVMESLGLRNIEGTSFREPREDVRGCYCRMQEQSMGKDTTVGHWEMAGMISPKPLGAQDNMQSAVLRYRGHQGLRQRAHRDRCSHRIYERGLRAPDRGT